MFINIMKNLFFVFLVFVCIGCDSKKPENTTIGSISSVEGKKEKEIDLISFVDTFYKVYSSYDLRREDELHKFILENGSKYLTQNLKSLILEDIKCAKEGYVCNLDMDPFYNSQEIMLFSKSVKDSDMSVKVFFKNNSNLKIMFDCEEKCLISNIVYPNGSNLDEILKQKE